MPHQRALPDAVDHALPALVAVGVALVEVEVVEVLGLDAGEVALVGVVVLVLRVGHRRVVAEVVGEAAVAGSPSARVLRPRVGEQGGDAAVVRVRQGRAVVRQAVGRVVPE